MAKFKVGQLVRIDNPNSKYHRQIATVPSDYRSGNEAQSYGLTLASGESYWFRETDLKRARKRKRSLVDIVTP